MRPLQHDDWPAVAAIYADDIATGDPTFETDVPDWDPWDAAHLAEPRLVAEVVTATARGRDVVLLERRA